MAIALDRFGFNTVTMGGEGLHDVPDMVQLLEDKGYRGHYTFEVFNDDYVNSDPVVIGQRAMKSARWISESHVAGGVPAYANQGTS